MLEQKVTLNHSNCADTVGILPSCVTVFQCLQGIRTCYVSPKCTFGSYNNVKSFTISIPDVRDKMSWLQSFILLCFWLFMLIIGTILPKHYSSCGTMLYLKMHCTSPLYTVCKGYHSLSVHCKMLPVPIQFTHAQYCFASSEDLTDF